MRCRTLALNMVKDMAGRGGAKESAGLEEARCSDISRNNDVGSHHFETETGEAIRRAQLEFGETFKLNIKAIFKN